MVSIVKLKIENFQSHENTVLEFDQGLNVIIGPSDQGKSAVIRAIKWAFYNDPRGMEFIRHGASMARVSVELSNGYTIVRERSQRVNRYTVMDPQNASLVLEGFGNEVPQEVIRAHTIPKVFLDTDKTSSLNISEQLEGPFLLSESGAMRAKAIGRLTGLHIMDRAIKNTMTDLRRENQTADRLMREVKEVDQGLEEFKDLPLLETTLKRLDIVSNKLESLILKYERLQSLQKALNLLNQEHKEVNAILEKLQKLELSEREVWKAEEQIKKIIWLKDSQKALNEIQSGIEESREIRRKTSNLDFLVQMVLEFDTKKTRFERFERISETFYNVKNEEKKIRTILEKTQQLDMQEPLVLKLVEKVELEKKLTVANTKVEELNHKIDEAADALKKTNQVDQSAKSVLQSEQKLVGLKRLEVLLESYQLVLGNIKEGKKFIAQNVEDMKKYALEYARLLKEAGKCPTCGGELSDLKLREIIKAYEEVN